LLVLSGCGSSSAGDDHKPPAPNVTAYKAGYDDGQNALDVGKETAVMRGDVTAAAEACEDIVGTFYGNGSLPPGFTAAQKQNWYSGCQDALQGLDLDDSHATAAPAASAT
jgi:hypothetical protein